MRVDRDNDYVEILIEPVRRCADYLPKMGGGVAIDIDGFTGLYGADPLYHWMGFDSPLMFAAHKAAGGMTSIYRQLGIGCERLFRRILRDELVLTADQVVWSYEMLPTFSEGRGGQAANARVLSLDGRVDLDDVKDELARARILAWIGSQCDLLDISTELRGAVFEVRQGYKSADSKRQNGDLANAAQALGHGYLPVLTIMSTQINSVVKARYRIGNWAILTGQTGRGTPSESTFDFLDQVIGYDLVAFFERNESRLRMETESVLARLLEARK